MLLCHVETEAKHQIEFHLLVEVLDEFQSGDVSGTRSFPRSADAARVFDCVAKLPDSILTATNSKVPPHLFCGCMEKSHMQLPEDTQNGAFICAMTQHLKGFV